jgi:16S rRNA (cytidine1402-2'-O)-methyltransferase
VLAEDTRKTRVLLDHFGIKSRMVAAHAHNEARTIPLVLEELARGSSVAMVTDAGTPLVSDPGSRLVTAVRAAGFRVSPIPGASAVTLHSPRAGTRHDSLHVFRFPRPIGTRTAGGDARDQRSATHGRVVRIANACCGHAQGSCSYGTGRPSLCVARELTKIFEEFRDGTVGELAAYYEANPPRGEVVILLAVADLSRSTRKSCRIA